VRTPMQECRPQPASRPNPQKLFMPVIIDPGTTTGRSTSPRSTTESLLWWVRRLTRARYPVFGHGSSSSCRRTTTAPPHPAATEGSWMTGRSSRRSWCLSRHPQYVGPISEFRGMRPVEPSARPRSRRSASCPTC
jgi:hypothetical protein